MNKQKKTKLHKNIFKIIYIIVCLTLGFSIGIIASDMNLDKYLDGSTLALIILFVEFIGAILIQIIIHEAGHLVGGLMSGYKFSSFRIGSMMWIKTDDKIKLKKHYLMGTLGQCLMEPPSLVDGRYPVMLYNLGGSLLNLITSVLCLGIFCIFDMGLYGESLVLLLGILGIIFAILNGIPFKDKYLSNDGYNAFSLSDDTDAMKAFWLQLKINEQQARDIRLKDMPDEWFEMPSDEAMKNTIVASTGAFVCNRYIDMHRLEEANELIKHLLSIEDSALAGIYRSLLICERIFIELVSGSDKEVIDELYTNELKQFMGTMKSFPSVIRTQYAYAVLYEEDMEKGEKLKKEFDKIGKTYPYKADMENEIELMELVAINDKKC